MNEQMTPLHMRMMIMQIVDLAKLSTTIMFIFYYSPKTLWWGWIKSVCIVFVAYLMNLVVGMLGMESVRMMAGLTICSWMTSFVWLQVNVNVFLFFQPSMKTVKWGLWLLSCKLICFGMWFSALIEFCCIFIFLFSVGLWNNVSDVVGIIKRGTASDYVEKLVWRSKAFLPFG